MYTSLRSRPIPAAFFDALTNALVSERQLIDEMATVILRQREAVGMDDLQAVDDSVFATHRLLIALSELRKRRRSLNRLISSTDTAAGITSLGDTPGAPLPPQLRTERDALKQAARRLSREIGINRRILRQVLDQRESSVHVVH